LKQYTTVKDVKQQRIQAGKILQTEMLRNITVKTGKKLILQDIFP